MINFFKRVWNRSANNNISYDDLKELMRNKEIYLIDVRSWQEYEEGHLDGAINIPVYNIENEIQKKGKR